MRGLWLSTLLAFASCGSSPPAQRQKARQQFAADLVPAELRATETPGDKSVFRVRVYADDAHRAQILNWERKISVMFRRASAVLGPTAGVELEIVETKQWARKAGEMEAMLAELEDLDPGGDVHLVIGLIDALPGVTQTIHQLGIARALGKHIVMRGLNDAKEVAVLEAALETMGRESRDELYSMRGKHKLTVVFLHEFAHVLGAMHVGEDLNLLAPTYDVKQSAFSKQNAALMRLAASFRAKDELGTDRSSELKALAAYIDGVPANVRGGWIEDERVLLRKSIDSNLSGALEGETTLSALSDQVRPDHRVLYRDAVKLADDGKNIEAWTKAEPLIDFYPDEPAVAVLACRIAAARKQSAAVVKKWCERAAVLAPADITPTLALAVADIDAKNVAKAVAVLASARERLLGVKGKHDKAWMKLAEAYQKLGLVALALDAAGRTEDAEAVATWAAGESAKYSVPPLDSKARGKKLSPALDADYVEAVKAALKLVYGRDFAKVKKAVAAADKRFGKTPGIETVRCDMEVRRRAYKVALAHCKRALKLFEAGSWSNYLTGLLHKQAKRSTAAAKHLERAIELDPTLRHAYEILAKVYDGSGEAEKATAVRAAFKKRFGSSL